MWLNLADNSGLERPHVCINDLCLIYMSTQFSGVSGQVSVANRPTGNKTIKSFKDLIVWQKSMLLTKSIYLLLEKIPSKEEFGLKNQLRRSAISVPSNIAEGSKRGTRKDFLHFVRTAHGSLAEIETQILIIKDLYSLEVSALLQEINEISKIMNGLISSLLKTET